MIISTQPNLLNVITPTRCGLFPTSVGVAVVSSYLLLFDGSSYLLLADGVSKLLLA